MEDMKVFEKNWQTEYQDIGIRVMNSWSLQHTSAALYINGKEVAKRDLPMTWSVSLQSLLGNRFDWQENGVDITVRIGSAWHLCGVACQILINGQYYYGNRVVLFSEKSSGNTP